CPSAEGDQAAVRCWVTHRQQQENSECDIDAHYHWHRRLSRENNIVSGTTPAVNNNPTTTNTIFSARSRNMLTSLSPSQSAHDSADSYCSFAYSACACFRGRIREA